MTALRLLSREIVQMDCFSWDQERLYIYKNKNDQSATTQKEKKPSKIKSRHTFRLIIIIFLLYYIYINISIRCESVGQFLLLHIMAGRACTETPLTMLTRIYSVA